MRMLGRSSVPRDCPLPTHRRTCLIPRTQWGRKAEKIAVRRARRREERAWRREANAG